MPPLAALASFHGETIRSARAAARGLRWLRPAAHRRSRSNSGRAATTTAAEFSRAWHAPQRCTRRRGAPRRGCHGGRELHSQLPAAAPRPQARRPANDLTRLHSPRTLASCVGCAPRRTCERRAAAASWQVGPGAADTRAWCRPLEAPPAPRRRERVALARACRSRRVPTRCGSSSPSRWRST